MIYRVYWNITLTKYSVFSLNIIHGSFKLLTHSSYVNWPSLLIITGADIKMNGSTFWEMVVKYVSTASSHRDKTNINQYTGKKSTE